MKKTDDEMLTTSQVCAILNLTPKAIHNLIAAGRLPNSIKLPGQTSPYLIPRSDVLAEQKRRQSIKQTD